MRKITLKHVSGKVDSADSLTEFAIRHDLGVSHITQILRDNKGNSRHFVKGWYDPTPLDKPIKLLTDEDELVEVFCVPEFVLDFELSKIAANKLLFGQGYHLGGLRKPNTPKRIIFEKPRYKYYFESPSGLTHETKSIRSLAKRYPHLNHRSLSYLMTGSRGHQKPDYKGWRFLEAKQIN